MDPYVKDGLAESGLTSIVLPSVKTAREGVELIAKIVEEKGAAEGNIVTIADKEGVWYMEILSGHQYAAILFPEDRFAVFPNTFFLGHVDLSDTERTIASKDLEKVAKKPIAIRKWMKNSTFLNPIIRLCKKQIALGFGRESNR